MKNRNANRLKAEKFLYNIQDNKTYCILAIILDKNGITIR